MTSELTGLLNLVHATEWQQPKSKLEIATVQAWTKGTFGDPVKLATGALSLKVPPAKAETEMEKKKREITGDKKFNEHETATTLNAWLPKVTSSIENEHYLHWQVAFPGIWQNWETIEMHGGFDAVIGNPPYVRQELIQSIKPGLKRAYPETYDGSADLYVYFYDQGLKLLKPGGRLSYVVTNKWMRAGYAEGLRELFASKAWIEFVADFGHAKKFFPDADVFPSVVVVRKPDGGARPCNTNVCVIPREDVPEKALDDAVAKATYPLPRAHFTKESWTLEQPDVVRLLQKVRAAGDGLGELSGLQFFLTGCNAAFVIDPDTRDKLIAQDARSEDLIKSYVRGQDVQRWRPRWANLWIIFARRGIDITGYPAIKAHLAKFKAELQPKPENWSPTVEGEKWKGRKEGSYAWYEIQDSVEYFPVFESPKIIYQAIQFHPRYCFHTSRCFTSNKTFVIGGADRSLVALLNSPLLWWISWRHFVHMKDEALSNDGFKMETLPIAQAALRDPEILATGSLLERDIDLVSQSAARMLQWLRHEFGVERHRVRPVVTRTSGSRRFCSVSSYKSSKRPQAHRRRNRRAKA